MKYALFAALLLAGLSACSDHKPVTERVVVEKQQQVPSREVVVEHQVQPTIDGETDERIVHERVVPRTQIQRTETTTTRDE